MSDLGKSRHDHHDRMENGDELNVLDVLLVLAKHKRMILGICVATFVVMCGFTLMMPNIYTANVRLLPPQDDKGSLGSMLGGMGDLAALVGLPGQGGSADRYVGMLQSRRIADAVIERFDLMERYEWTTRIGAYSALAGKVKIKVDKKSQFLTLSVDDENPQFAAKLANAYVEELKKLNQELNLKNAGRERLFLEERLDMVKVDLANAEDRLKDFQEKNNAIKIDAQASAVIETISRVKGELASREVALGVLLTSQTEQNPQVKAMRQEIHQLKAQLKQLETSSADDSPEDIFIATSAVPGLGVQYARLLRDFKVQEKLYELLTKQYELAKITEAKNSSHLQVLDPATVPDRKSKPARAIIVLMTTVGAGFLAVLLAYLREYQKRMPEGDRRRWSEIKNHLRLGKPGRR